MASPAWHSSNTDLVDIAVFGETAVVGGRRVADGRPQQLPAGVAQSPRGMAGAITVAELARTEAGMLALRGPMVPRHAFPPGAENGPLPKLRPNTEGFVDTGCPCRLDSRTGTLVVTGPPAGLVTVGGCRFAMRNLEEAVRRADPEAAVVALPDALGGHRLAGHASDPERVRMALEAEGANALLADAFRPRRAREAA
jgi:hypothetical protein